MELLLNDMERKRQTLWGQFAGAGVHVQNRSPIAPTSPLSSCLCRIVHNQLGYSSSASATGSCLFFSKFRPLSGVPATTLLLTSGVAFFPAALAAFFSIAGLGSGVSGALKGCAAEVEVAAGGVWDDIGEPWRGVGCEAEEMGVALFHAGELERKRRVDALGMRAVRRQVRQIIVDVWVLLGRLEYSFARWELLSMAAGARAHGPTSLPLTSCLWTSPSYVALNAC